MSTKVIGIDLGTGNSAVGVVNEVGDVQVAVNANGNYTTPSIVMVKDGERLVGEAAKRQMIMNPKNTVSFVKRYMGADWNDPDVQKMNTMATYDVVNENDKPRIKIDNKLYSPEEISSYICAHMKKVAEDYYGEEVTKAVITCPAFFNDVQRQATKTAGELAGLEVLRIINEPTAAILASDIDTSTDKTVMVIDSGCGTVDVSIVEISNVDGQAMYEVLASYGDVFLGGQNYDNAIVEYICDEFKKQYGIDLRNDQMAYSRIVTAAEKAKVELSSSSSTDISEPYITVKDGSPLMLNMQLTRAKFEQLIEEFNNKTVDCGRVALEKAGKSNDEIDCILLVGGTTRIPSLQEAFTKAFNIPLNKSVNPDQAVALGAATQANILAGGKNAKDILLLDVTPLSLGIETEGGLMTVMVPANTTIPISKEETFTTAADNQTSVGIMVYQGERPMAKDNKLIGQFFLDGIMPARRGTPQITVKFEVSADGILSVSATDKATGKEQHITVQNQSLSDDEINRIKKEAEAHAEDDKKRKEEVEELNSLETYAYTLKGAIEEDTIKSKITDAERDDITKGVQEVVDAVNKKDIAAAKSAKQSLEAKWTQIATKIYSANQGQPQPDVNVNESTTQSTNTTNTTDSSSDKDVEDVAFEEVKD
jgi:molecular chaperone DnaK